MHLGSVGGQDLPWWDRRAKFGDTNYLVVNPEEGASLAEHGRQNDGSYEPMASRSPAPVS